MNCVLFAINEILPLDWVGELGMNTGISSQELIPIFLKYGYALIVIYKYHERILLNSCVVDDKSDYFNNMINKYDCIVCGFNGDIPHCWVHKNNVTYDRSGIKDLGILELNQAWIPIKI